MKSSLILLFVAAAWACLVVPVAAKDKDMYCGDVTCYEALGIDREVPDTAVKKAYRKLSLK